MQGHNIYFNGELLKIIPELYLLPLSICRTNNNVPTFMPQTSIVSKKQPVKVVFYAKVIGNKYCLLMGMCHTST